MAMALCMAIPLFNYLRQTSARPTVRIAATAALVLTVIAVLGSYSRGGFLALTSLALFFWWRSERRFRTALAALLVLVPAILFMPEQWAARMESTEAYDQDESALSRFDAWTFSWRLAEDHPLLGGGVNSIWDHGLWEQYNPGTVPHVAHSIYFQVLADCGFVGLALYLALAASAWRNTVVASRLARGSPTLAWAGDLAIAIRLSFFAFLAGGAFLSVAYYDVYVTLIAASVGLRRLLESRVASDVKEPRRPRAPVAAGPAPAAPLPR